jgi:serine/threonine protein kinase
VAPNNCAARKLVVKVFSTGDETVLESARNEAAILKKLNHPLIVKFRDYFEDPTNNKAYIVMEEAGSQSLYDFVKSGAPCAKDAKVIT